MGLAVTGWADLSAAFAAAWAGADSAALGYAAAVALLGYTVLGVAGFGSALVIVPLLTWRFELALVVPLVLLVDVPASLLHTGLNLREVAWREIPRLVPTVVVGTLLGTQLIVWTRGTALLVLLGLYVIGVALRGLRGLRQAQVAAIDALPAALPPPAPVPVRVALAGLAIGLVEAMFGTAGPVVMAWLLTRTRDPRVLRATLPMCFALFSALAVASAGLAGLLAAPQLWVFVVTLLPMAAVGVLAGHAVAGRLGAGRLAPLIYTLLGLSGCALLVRGLSGL